MKISNGFQIVYLQIYLYVSLEKKISLYYTKKEKSWESAAHVSQGLSMGMVFNSGIF